MSELLQFLRTVFDSPFMPHGQCYLWQPGLVWLQAGSNALIALAYFLIPPALLWFVRERDDLAFRWMFGLFGAFILLCGMTHLMGVWTIWSGNYWLDGSIRLVTGVVSFTTAVLLFPLVPRALELPSPADLRAANRELQEEIAQRRDAEARLAEKAEELERAYDELKETERLKTEFFANVSHELRTPLTLILSPLDTALEEAADDDSDDRASAHRRRLETARDNAVRMLQMVNGLLDFSRLEIDEIEVDRRATDLGALTRSVCEDFEPLVQRADLELSVRIDPELSTVAVDRYLYERILFNLLSNAVKFTPEGGEVEVDLTAEHDRARLTVRDTGIGIDDEERSRIFEDFRQIEASSTRRFEGTGLGLPLVKEFAELLDGTVEVDSTPGEGSTFTVNIEAPVRDRSSEEVDLASTSAPAPKVKRSYSRSPGPEQSTDASPQEDLPEIVLAEDNDELAAYLEELLADTCWVHRAPNGRNALELVGRENPDLVVADVMMPETDGLTLCRTLKDDPGTIDIPVVMLTALTDREALLEGWEVGADEYLFKPFHPHEVVTRIRTLLENVHRRKEAEAEKRRLEGELLQVSEKERRRIGRELHDGVASHLSGTAMLAGGLAEDAEAGRTPDAHAAREVADLVQEAARRTRSLARGLNPVNLDEDGLPAALQELVDRQNALSDADCLFRQHGRLPRLEERVPSHLYYLAEEAIHNAVRHASASRIEILLEIEGDELNLSVRDDGIGLDGGADGERTPAPGGPTTTAYPGENEQGEGMGLRTMRYRAEQAGGGLTIESARDEGTLVRCRIPSV